MTSSLLWERYEELMQSSAAALDQLKDAGFDRNSTAHGPRQSEVLGDQSIPLMREAGHPNPIVLSSSSSSSSSDSEDDVPLSLRLKKGKVGVQPGTAAIRTAAPASDIQDPPLGNAISHADPRQAGVEQPEIGNKSSDARTSGFAQRTAQGAESQAKTSPLSSPPPKRRKKEPQKTAGSPQQQNIRGGPRQKEGVIDLEADKDSDMEFVTAAPPLPTRKTSLKHLQKMNPGLARAVQERCATCVLKAHLDLCLHSAVRLAGTTLLQTKVFIPTTVLRTASLILCLCVLRSRPKRLIAALQGSQQPQDEHNIQGP